MLRPVLKTPAGKVMDAAPVLLTIRDWPGCPLDGQARGSDRERRSPNRLGERRIWVPVAANFLGRPSPSTTIWVEALPDSSEGMRTGDCGIRRVGGAGDPDRGKPRLMTSAGNWDWCPRNPKLAETEFGAGHLATHKTVSISRGFIQLGDSTVRT